MINYEVTYLYSKEDNFDKKLSKFLRLRNISNIDIEKNVLDIINQVKLNGYIALINMINKFDKITFSLIIGGALGNFYDRLVLKAVPDFIDFHIKNFHWFTFNVADIFISLGITLMIFKELLVKPKL